MKKTLLTLVLVCTTLIFACSKKEAVEPEPTPSTNTSFSDEGNSNLLDTVITAPANSRINICDIKSELVKFALAGTPSCPKKWNVIYLDGATNQRLQVPGLISSTLPNTFYWLPNNRVLEYSYLDPLEQGIPMDTGVYHIIDCGRTSLINTNLSGGDNPFKLEKVNLVFWQGTFFIPAGPNGSLVNVRVKGYLTHQ